MRFFACLIASPFSALLFLANVRLTRHCLRGLYGPTTQQRYRAGFRSAGTWTVYRDRARLCFTDPVQSLRLHLLDTGRARRQQAEDRQREPEQAPDPS